MPYTPAQTGLFRAAAHSKQFADKVGIPMDRARQMTSEGTITPVAKITNALLKHRGRY